MKKRLIYVIGALAVLAGCSDAETTGTATHFSADILSCTQQSDVGRCFREQLEPGQLPQRVYAVERDGNKSVIAFWPNNITALSALRSLGLSDQIDVYNVPVVTAAQAAGLANVEDGVVSIVNVPSPWYAPKVVINGRMRDAVPDYAAIPGLDFKYFTTSESGTLGGIYLWNSRASADAFYDADWHARIQNTYGQSADLQFYELAQINRGTAEVEQ
ncbi:MAG: lipoprotein [Kordiimonadaceae bacterium]|nr:lipoprotein [Kordiimonadaceae bacterium]MBO6568136.1 lipoprotein [Kordiimonadaceae bacterium]MBO6964134.1 lipoprotein [Kordiimonadaceae bacterium]